MLIDICRFNRRWKRVPSRLRTNQTYQNFNYSAEIVVMNSISLSIKMYLRLYHHSLSLCLSLSPLLLHTFPSWSLSLSSCFYLCIIMLLLCVSFSKSHFLTLYTFPLLSLSLNMSLPLFCHSFSLHIFLSLPYFYTLFHCDLSLKLSLPLYHHFFPMHVFLFYLTSLLFYFSIALSLS